ncbi:unnamed protein product [Microthlaspi erraticum]|uniref:Uncharacterized protein n=1 Tax=Microthlaspi erraticum TaxID=1685480 RepID=A0A6D2I727_9BRAS|nr:unnamed protein product [Microthlaspi erraticum]
MSSVVYLMIRDDFSVLSFGFADQNVILWSPVKFGGLWSRRLGVGRNGSPCARVAEGQRIPLASPFSGSGGSRGGLGTPRSSPMPPLKTNALGKSLKVFLSFSFAV